MTDTLQGIIMTIGTFLLLFFVIKAGGGMGEITTQLNATNPGWDLLGKGIPFSEGLSTLSPGYMISFWVLVGVGSSAFLRRRSEVWALRILSPCTGAMMYGTVVVGILMIGMHFAGALTLPLLPEEGISSTDAVIPYVVMEYMPSVAAGFFLCRSFGCRNVNGIVAAYSRLGYDHKGSLPYIHR